MKLFDTLTKKLSAHCTDDFTGSSPAKKKKKRLPMIAEDLGNNTPENFKKALELTKERILADPNCPRIMNINSWNEWTEGSYLEPDTRNGFGYLDAIKEVFK